MIRAGLYTATSAADLSVSYIRPMLASSTRGDVAMGWNQWTKSRRPRGVGLILFQKVGVLVFLSFGSLGPSAEGAEEGGCGRGFSLPNGDKGSGEGLCPLTLSKRRILVDT